MYTIRRTNFPVQKVDAGVQVLKRSLELLLAWTVLNGILDLECRHRGYLLRNIAWNVRQRYREDLSIVSHFSVVSVLGDLKSLATRCCPLDQDLRQTVDCR